MISESGTYDTRLISSETSLHTNAWYHVALVRDKNSNDTARLFVNGVLKQTAELNGLTLNYSEEDMSVGNWPDSSGGDTCAKYLLNHSDYLHYNEYLKRGYPIATGIIEGACRYLIKDRMEITGARWSLKGAEALLTHF